MIQCTLLSRLATSSSVEQDVVRARGREAKLEALLIFCSA